MSIFYIKVEDGYPTGDPMPLSAARSIGYFDYGYRKGEIPENLERFKPSTEPFANFDQVVESDGDYHKIDGTWQRVYEVRQKTAEELAAYKAEIISEWENGPLAYPSWSYNEATGQMSPPVEPVDMRNPVWDEETQTWSGDPIPEAERKIT
tara:strand:+ start:1641 stop:2093 length:453 start_codon:yes stop_codon:yes gene_type:complete